MRRICVNLCRGVVSALRFGLGREHWQIRLTEIGFSTGADWKRARRPLLLCQYIARHWRSRVFNTSFSLMASKLSLVPLSLPPLSPSLSPHPHLTLSVCLSVCLSV